jgi:hypothetical protein
MSENWQNGSYIRADTDYLEQEAVEKESLIFSWFKVQSNLQETGNEQSEKIQAVRMQISAGVLQPNGMPHGMKPAPIKENSFEKKRRRQLQRQQQKLNRKQQKNVDRL